MSIWDEPDILTVGRQQPRLSPYRIGLTIKRLRVASRMTQDDLAALIGRSRGAIAQWETLRTNPEIAELPRLAEALNTEIRNFFQGE